MPHRQDSRSDEPRVPPRGCPRGRAGRRRAAPVLRLGALALAMALPVSAAAPQQAGQPSASTVTIYDQGFALVQEIRHVALQAGENELLFSGVPRTLDPATTAFTVTAGPRQLDLLEQTFASNASPPELRWTLNSGGAGSANLRLSYRAGGFGWSAAHELALDSAGLEARYSTRVALQNRSGRSFDGARIKLVLTERGAAPKLPIETGKAGGMSQRFTYGGQDAMADRLVAGLAPVQAYELATALDLPDGATKYVTMFAADHLPVRRVFVYDGVRFDRFQRNPRTDWNYGTESHDIVDAFVEFDNGAAGGPGQPLPPGRLRLLQRRDGDVLDLLGETELPQAASNAAVRARLGPARGWQGERERSGYVEIRQAREYEESFVIRLRNESGESATVRVVEHLYRSEDFEIVKADTEYKKTGPQVIEFSPELKAGGRRSIHYTVRYRW